MKKQRLISGLLSFLTAAAVLTGTAPAAYALGPAEVSITVDGESAHALQGARRVGTNIEMSLTSDEMWAANGNWMEQTFAASGLSMMRWGYDAWAFNWETEEPLSPSRYWGGLNTHDAAGTFGLREFIAFCKKHQIIPFVMIPLESLDTFGGEATLEQIKALTSSMAQYIAEQGIETCYFDMGNEVWNHGADGIANAEFLGGLYPEFQQIVKNANPNYKLVLQRAPENILWNRWNDTLVKASQGAFDAYDDHRYSFYGWDKYFDYDGDDLLVPGKRIEGKEAILGECDIGWTPIQDNWAAGHVRDHGGGMALLNALLNMIDREEYAHIVTWPSHWPSKASNANDGDQAFGWFNLDTWYLTKGTERFTGPILAHRIINQNVLENRLTATSSAPSVRVFSYQNADATDLRVIVINKWDPTALTVHVPAQYHAVDAMVMNGDDVWDTTPEYVSHLAGSVPVANGVLQDNIPGECVVVYHFSSDPSVTAPPAPQAILPAEGAAGSTAQAFSWQAVPGATNYHLVVSPNPDLSAPVIDTYTGPSTAYQPSGDLETATAYYWAVMAVNQAGESAGAAVHTFVTPGAGQAKTLVLNEDSPYIGRSGGWNLQQSQGSYMGNDMSSEQAGAYAEFTFTGTQAKLYGITGNWCGLAQVQVDQSAPVQIDTYSAQPQDQALLYDTGELPYGQHTVLLRVLGSKNEASSGCWIEFDKAEVLDSASNAPAVDAAVWNDDDARLNLFSIWTHQAMDGCYHNDDLSSNTWKAHVEFQFDGTNAVIYGLKAPWCGTADISVDGTTVATVDTYAPQEELQAVWYDTGELPAGTHTVRITVNAAQNDASSGKWIELDKIVWR